MPFQLRTWRQDGMTHGTHASGRNSSASAMTASQPSFVRSQEQPSSCMFT